MKELKPCPFCGAEAKLLGGTMAQELYSIWCANRHHMEGGFNADKLIADWNSRANKGGNTK